MEQLRFLLRKFLQFPYLESLLRRDSETMHMVETLHRRENKREKFLDIWCQRMQMLAVVVTVAVLSLASGLCQSPPEDVIVGENFLRKREGEEQASFEVAARTEEGIASQEITVDLSEEQEQTEAVSTPNPEEVLLAEIREAVQDAVSTQKEGAKDGKITLPQTVSGKELSYRNLIPGKDFTSFYLSIVLLGILPVLWRHRRQELMKKRDKQLSLDYPELVSKCMLLLSAGLTVRGSMERIGEEYRLKISEGGETRYVYEEILYMLQEMGHGIPETKAIENFGKRCRLLSYLRFSSLITQNMRKGSAGLIELLEAESLDAFDKRKEQVKVMGETAGTRLLLPMILMLGVVMVIVIVPAFMTM